jgi:hypothetical protein
VESAAIAVRPDRPVRDDATGSHRSRGKRGSDGRQKGCGEVVGGARRGGSRLGIAASRNAREEAAGGKACVDLRKTRGQHGREWFDREKVYLKAGTKDGGARVAPPRRNLEAGPTQNDKFAACHAFAADYQAHCADCGLFATGQAGTGIAGLMMRNR